MQSLIDIGADFILAEPVGSCADLAATVLKPFKDRRADVDLSPFTVLVSPDHVREAVGECESEMRPGTLYILRQQMAEADRLLLNKTDVLDAAERAELLGLLRSEFPGRDVGELSARTGDGVESWLADLLAGGDCGSHSIDVDYDRYAGGEAVLGWLNATIQLNAVDVEADLLPPTLTLMDALHREFRDREAPIAHVKTVIESGGAQRTANLTSLHGDIVVPDRTPLRGSKATRILNARVQAPAEELDTIARLAIAGFTGPSLRAVTSAFRCLTPARPRPTYGGKRQ